MNRTKFLIIIPILFLLLPLYGCSEDQELESYQVIFAETSTTILNATDELQNATKADYKDLMIRLETLKISYDELITNRKIPNIYKKSNETLLQNFNTLIEAYTIAIDGDLEGAKKKAASLRDLQINTVENFDFTVTNE